MGIIDKCHNLCKTCNKPSEIVNDAVHMNCITCLYNNANFKPKFEGDCPESEKKDEQKEDKSSQSHMVTTWVVFIIIIILIIAIVAYIFYKKVKSKEIDYKSIEGKTISMEEDISINPY